MVVPIRLEQPCEKCSTPRSLNQMPIGIYRHQIRSFAVIQQSRSAAFITRSCCVNHTVLCIQQIGPCDQRSTPRPLHHRAIAAMSSVCVYASTVALCPGKWTPQMMTKITTVVTTVTTSTKLQFIMPSIRVLKVTIQPMHL